MTSHSELLTLLAPHGQEHLLQWWPELSAEQQTQLANEIRQLDLDLVRELIALRDAPHEAGQQSRAAAAESPQDLVRVPQTEAEQSRLIEAGTLGEALLRQGKVAAVLVAGGQGSRLGFDAPKGVFPIGPVSERTLFQVLCEQIAERSNLAGAAIPYLIMTSAATHAETVEFFQQQDFFGLGEENVFFFQQASLPAIDDASPRILMSSKHSLALSPDGHGGMLRALRQSGLLQQMANRGIEHFYYHQVDNPTAIVCDPVFLGLHASSNSEMSTKVVAKVSPEERMGVVVTIDGQTQIIEYSDLTPEESRRQDASGDLIFWAGNTAIHAFRLDFLQRLTATTISLPFHIAHKPVAHVGTDGSVVPAVPSQPNANKFEQFIFDALPQANVALVQEADRAREFNPVKNAEGNDSPATSRAALNRIAREWAEAAGCEVAESVQLEVSPLFALDAEKFAQRVPAGTRFTEDQILS